MRISDWSSDVCSSDLSIRSEIEGRLHAPDLVDVHHPSVDSAADVRAAYQPRGLAGVPAGPGGGQSSTAADIIEEGRADIDLTREAAQSMRGHRIQSAVHAIGRAAGRERVCKDLSI